MKIVLGKHHEEIPIEKVYEQVMWRWTEWFLDLDFGENAEII